MSHRPLRVGIVGAGANTRARHVPGLRACPGVQIAAVCNRRPDSTAAAAREFGIPRTFDHWEDLVADPDLDAVVIGTWPYLHCPITLAALSAGKHVLTEARMARTTAEARQMRDASKRRPDLVAQIVPSPYGLHGDTVVREMLADGAIGELREYHVWSLTPALADPDTPLHWRQDADLSGVNALTLGILHETVSRWLPQPMRVLAQAHAFTPTRTDPASGSRRPVGTPDSVQALTVLPGGARGVYQFSGAVPSGSGSGVRLFGTKGALFYDLGEDRVYVATGAGPFAEVPVPPEKAGGWRCEADFVASIRDGAPVRFTSFDAGVVYMEFTEAVARSSRLGAAVSLPLVESFPW